MTDKNVNPAILGPALSFPTSKSTIQQSRNRADIEFPPVSTADDIQFVTRLTTLVNKAYGKSEGSIFKPGYQRTSQTEISDLLRSEQLAVAFLHEETSDDTTLRSSRTIIGCVYVKLFSATKGDFGMLALDEDYHGGGLGRQLVAFAEEHCRQKGCTIMQLELLVPSGYEHEGKKRLQAWYLRMGYRIVRLEDFSEEYPHLAPMLAGPADYNIFEKPLI